MSLANLWLPILVATVLCFIASALIWMIAPHHKKEWPPVPGQDDLIATLRKHNVGQGNYMFPHADRSDKTAFEAASKQWAEGPAGVLYIFPKGKLNMGKMMALQFVYFLLVNTLVALADSRVIGNAAVYLYVFKFTALLAFMAHSLGTVPEAIWFGRPWKSIVLQGVDSLIYAGLTAGTYGWLWPK